MRSDCVTSEPTRRPGRNPTPTCKFRDPALPQLPDRPPSAHGTTFSSDPTKALPGLMATGALPSPSRHTPPAGTL